MAQLVKAEYHQDRVPAQKWIELLVAGKIKCLKVEFPGGEGTVIYEVSFEVTDDWLLEAFSIKEEKK